MKDILYLGSQSLARQNLLKSAKIPFKLLAHGSDEVLEEQCTTFAGHVLAIAQGKMRSLALPSREQIGQDYIFVLTADTLIKDLATDTILSKPVDRQAAIEMIASERNGPVEVTTGCCLEKFYFNNGQWELETSAHWTTCTLIEFFVDEDCVDLYLEELPIALQCSGAGVIEGHGLSYLKSIQGSYTGAIGLPLYELRQALRKLEFKF